MTTAYDPRYAAQARFHGVGAEGQAALQRSRVLVVGLGATGGAVAASLARAGVGGLTIVDRDFLEITNLPRQTLYTDDDLTSGLPKAEAAAARLRRLDPHVEVVAHVADFHAGNAAELARGHDLAIDGTDNFAARYVLNDVALELGIPWIYQAAVAAHGATMTFGPQGLPCFRCLHPEAPGPGTLETCDTSGVLHGAVAAVAGAASVEAVKVLTGHRSAEGMLYLDLWSGAVQRFEVSSLPDCPSCALRELPALRDPEATEAVAAQLCGRDAVHVRPAPTVVDLDAVADRLPAAATVTVRSPHLLRFDADGREITLFPDGRAIVKGTSDPAAARSLYARWIGV